MDKGQNKTWNYHTEQKLFNCIDNLGKDMEIISSIVRN